MSKLSIPNILNAGLVVLQSRLQATYCVGMPTYVTIEPTNECMGGCVLCPVGQERLGRPRGRMAWKDFKRLITQISDYSKFISMYKWGEPLMHPHIYDMIRYAKRRGIYTRMSSNLHPFRVEDAGVLVQTGLDELVVSLHGLSEETYQKYKPGHYFRKVIEKVEVLVEAKKRLQYKTPHIRLNFVVHRKNEHEVSSVPKFAASLGVDHLLVEVSLNLRFLPYDRQMVRRPVNEAQLCAERLALMDHWLPKDQKRVHEGYRRIRRGKGRMPGGEDRLFQCLAPWRQMFICWNGDVDLCAGGYEEKHSVGNVFNEPVRRIWNNLHYQAARRAICGRRRSTDLRVLCDHCPGVLL